MDIKSLITMLEKLKLQLLILQLQLRVLLLHQQLTIPNLGAPNKIIIHHAGGFLNFEGVNAWHKIRWNFRSSLGFHCGYQYFIEMDGKIYQARRDNEEGAHCLGQNKQSIGICLMGDGTKQDFTKEQYEALEELVKNKLAEYNLTTKNIYPHSAFSATECPSNYLRNWIIKNS